MRYLKKILCSRRKRDKPSDGPRIWAVQNMILKWKYFYDFGDTRVRIFFIILGPTKKFYVRGRNKINLVTTRRYEPLRLILKWEYFL
jgi:hypothetical protein